MQLVDTGERQNVRAIDAGKIELSITLE